MQARAFDGQGFDPGLAFHQRGQQGFDAAIGQGEVPPIPLLPDIIGQCFAPRPLARLSFEVNLWTKPVARG